jgi:putative Mn2+ efflux pump MntP
MGFIELVLIAIGLSMDAFAVSVCKGLSMKKMSWRKSIVIGLYFGIFQAIMPLIGYFLGVGFQSKITSIDHWIAFVLLTIIGINMIKESIKNNDEDDKNDDINFKTMIILAIATSIDALAVGITFAFLNVNIFISAGIIGIITFTLSVIGVKIGNAFGDKYESKAKLAGGIILILMGLKILLEHLNIIKI